VILKEYQKSYLALELKAGKKWLEDSLHVLSDERCERAGGTRSGSVMDVRFNDTPSSFASRWAAFLMARGSSMDSQLCSWFHLL
jgi:hypothetical protein